MKNRDKTREELTKELSELRRRQAELEALLAASPEDRGEAQSATVCSGSTAASIGAGNHDETAQDRESELLTFRALYDLAVAMTADRSLDENLALLVEKSRELLRSDKAFIALRDEATNELYMHSLSGIVTQEFKKLRIPMGVGLGGKVAQTGRLIVVQDYLAEVGTVFQDVAGAEGLQSGIAVPVQIGRINVGVLYVFNRTRTPFSQTDLDTLSLLGNLAALEVTRKRAKEELRLSQERYKTLYTESERMHKRFRTLLDVSPDPIVVYDMQGIPSYTNPAFTRIFGWTFEELEGKRTDFVPPENWPETRSMIQKVLTGKRFSDQETRRFTKDGRVLDVSISGAPFFDEGGNPTGSVVHLRDITARKLAKLHLAAELKKFRGLYDVAVAMTAERTLEENLSLIVESAREMLAADKSVIALRDFDRGDLYMHTYSGIITDEFKTLRIPFGVGLGGRVAQTGKLHVVEDYFQEIGPAFHHIARKEGLLSGIAVPMQTGRTNVGVLYVYNRQRTPFSQSDLDTLSLLGNLAAVEITRKRARQRLKEGEEKFKKLYDEAKRREELYLSLLNSSADAIVIYDMQGLAHYVSPSFSETFGWTVEEVLGKRIPFVPDAEVEPTMRIIRGLIEDGTPCSRFETKRFTKDGRVLDISISSSRYRDHEGNPAGILVILRDITDRKKAEERLRESEARFRTLAEVAPFGIVVIAADETTEYINPKFTELMGFTKEDLPDLNEWFQKAYSSRSSRIRAEAIWRGETSEIKVMHGIGAEAKPRLFKIRCKDGGSKIVSFRSVVLTDGRVIATFLDVTAETEAQQQIVRAKNEWERTFNSVSDLILILDGRRHIVRANKALTDRLGTGPERLIGMRCPSQAPYDGPPTSLCPDFGDLSPGREHCAEISDQSLGGVFDLRVSPLRDDAGKLVGTVHVARDITAFKSMERARRLAVHHMAHELRTPVAIIKASVKDLASDSVSSDGKKRRLERIQRGLARLTDIQLMVQEIVSPREYRPQKFNVTQALHGVLDEIKKQTRRRQITVTARSEEIQTDAMDPSVFTDVVNTLVKNSIENTPDQGDVSIALRKDRGSVLLEIQDSGVGIGLNDKKFVFDAFHHIQDTDEYATRNPFDFDAGGKGLELMRLKILSEEGYFDIDFESQRCRHIEGGRDKCPGRIDSCPHVRTPEECKNAGGTRFVVRFKVPAGKTVV